MSSLLLVGAHFDAFQKEVDSLFKKCSKKGTENRNVAAESINLFVSDFSDQIVSYSKRLYLNINAEEYICRDKPNINALAKYTTQISYLVSASVLQQNRRSKRIFYYEMWVQSMHNCFKKGDYTGAFAIYNGLNLFL